MSFVASTSHAAKPSFHTTAELTVSYSDNILAAPEHPPPLDPPVAPPAKDVVMRVAPGVALLYETARTKWTARYSHPFIFHFEHTGSDTDADVLHVETSQTPSELDELAWTWDLARYTTTSVSTLQPSDETTIGPQRGSGATLLTLGSAGEWRRQLSLAWAWTQSGMAALAVPITGGTTMFTSNLRVGPRYSLDDHAFGLTPSIGYSAPLTDAPVGETGFQRSEQVLVGGLSEWQWAFAPPDWSFALRAGAIAALEGEETEVEPIGGAAVRFQREEGYSATLSYDRGYVPNIITGQTFFTNSVALRGDLPIAADYDLRASTGSGFALGRAIDLQRSVVVDDVKTLIVDASVGWYPDLYPHIELRYQYTRQWDAPEDQIVLPNFNRNLFGLSVRYMWPPIELTLPKGHRKNPDEERSPLAPIR